GSKPHRFCRDKTTSTGLQRICAKATSINFGWDDVEWGIIQGKMATLAWVMGSEWEGAFDT
ncbi:MAG TPA: DUF4062 domain-containing protein, partial [Blastocatellia bacterium]